jgi:hypothetical protein
MRGLSAGGRQTFGREARLLREYFTRWARGRHDEAGSGRLCASGDLNGQAGNFDAHAALEIRDGTGGNAGKELTAQVVGNIVNAAVWSGEVNVVGGVGIEAARTRTARRGDAADQSNFGERVERVVDGGEAQAIFLDAVEEFVSGRMRLGRGEGLVEDFALTRAAKAVLFEKGADMGLVQHGELWRVQGGKPVGMFPRCEVWHLALVP